MRSQTVHLPDGQTYTVAPVFGGVGFKKNDCVSHHAHLALGWTTILNTQEERPEFSGVKEASNTTMEVDEDAPPRVKMRTRPFTEPTLQNDSLFLSSISSPSDQEYKAPASPTRHIAMILWVTLYWYFHQPQPEPYVHTHESKSTPQDAKPSGEWKIIIKRDGVLKGKNLIPKLERMGLLATEETEVGTELDDSGELWTRLFVSQRMFWQTPANLFLFTLQPAKALSPYPGSPAGSRPGSPTRGGDSLRPNHAPHPSQSRIHSDLPGAPMPTALSAPPNYPIGPFFSTSHLPTYYPPPPLQYTFTGNLRHPLRPKPPRMGEVFYTRFIPSQDQYLSFRVASLSPQPVPYLGPLGPRQAEHESLRSMSDMALLKMWFENPRVVKFWGSWHDEFLSKALRQRHSFPVIGLWDGVPFGYFEIYWVKEDILGQLVGGDANDWDRGLHILVGEEWSRGRVSSWLTSLAHWCFTQDSRTMNVCLEPRVDNDRMLRHLDANGFGKERQISFPHKQAFYVRLKRDMWIAPTL